MQAHITNHAQHKHYSKWSIKQLSKLNPGKAAGPDNLTSRILKELHSEVAPMLSDIFNSSLREGEVPDDWRNASVSPVYKKGAKTNAENYRLISLTCICCKVMEHVITSNIMAYLDKHQLLHSNQHGFRKKLSCETQLIKLALRRRHHNVSYRFKPGRLSGPSVRSFKT